LVKDKNVDCVPNASSRKNRRTNTPRTAQTITPPLIKPSYISILHIAQEILDETLKYLRAHGNKGKECIVFWSGRLSHKNKAHITSCIYPNQEATSISADVSLVESAKIHYLLSKRQEFLFAQVHSHPGEAFHSNTDNFHPITDKPGFFSIVVPYYCTTGLNDLSRCAVFEYKGRGVWRRLDQRERNKRFKIERQTK